MGWGAGNLGGGGGGGLNFRVVGGTSEPSNPKENEIWINTSVEINGYALSVDQPSELTEGLVWIKTGTASAVDFNALKKNVLTVYPLSAMQVISGSFQTVTAVSYQGGRWVSWWSGELYTPGNTYDGWMEVDMALDSVFTQKGTLAITQGESSMSVEQMTYAAGKAYVYSRKLDMSQYSKLTFEGVLFATGTVVPQSASVCIWSELGTYQTDNLVASINHNAAEKKLDVSAIDQECYIGIFLWSTSSYADITRLVLE